MRRLNTLASWRNILARPFSLWLIAALALVATPALAAPHARGVVYAGNDMAGAPVVVKLSGDGKQVVQVITQWDTSCQNGGDFPWSEELPTNTKIGSNGAFTVFRQIAVTLNNQLVQFTMRFSGKVTGKSIAGSTAETIEIFDDAGGLLDTCTAQATFKAVSTKGTVFGGATSQRLPVAVELGTGNRVHHFHFGWQADCTDGVVLQEGDLLVNLSIHAGRFGRQEVLRHTESNGDQTTLTYILRGAIKGAQASGTLSVAFSVADSSGNELARCDTQQVLWKAATG